MKARKITTMQVGKELDRLLHVDAFTDSSHNGIQVQNSGRIGTVCCGVDASMEFFRAAVEKGAGLVICHHGLSWGDSLRRITGMNFRRIEFLIQNDIALYACHLPLDAHPRYGNNAVICKGLGLGQLKPFGQYAGRLIGFSGRLRSAVTREEFQRRVSRLTGSRIQVMPFGPERISTVGVVSGGAAEEIADAGAAGLDAYLTGEPKLEAYGMAQELGVNAFFAGHYATEVFGVRALGQYVSRRYRVKAEFVDLRVPY